jgi:hypothetical protein
MKLNLPRSPVLFAILGLVALLASVHGCADARDTSAGPDRSAASSAAPKSKIPIQVEGRAASDPGQPVDVEISVTALSDARGVSIEFMPGEDLEILAGGEPVRHAIWTRGDAAVQTLSVVSHQSGTAYVKVHVTALFDGHARGAAYAIPVVIGGDPRANLKTADTPYVLDDDGQLLIQVPGERR